MKQLQLVNTSKFVLVDDEDYPYLSQFTWYLRDNGTTKHAHGIVDGKYVYMHQLLLKVPDTLTVDHKDGNGLNNQRYNLRPATMSQQGANGPKKCGDASYKGVTFDKFANKWKAQIKVNYKNIHLGRFDTQEQAAKAYNGAAKFYFGEFARLNKVA